jgi:hypothetical protein
MNTDTTTKTTVDVPRVPLVMPTVQEIALIAATLARNTPEQAPNVLADAALKLYAACDHAVFHLQIAAREKKARNRRALYSGFEEKELPITRDVFFQRMLPQYQNRADELARIAKDFLRDRLRQNNTGEPTLDEVADAYMRFGPFEHVPDVASMARKFYKWRELSISKSRRDAGLVGHQKKSEKKALKDL